MMVRQAGRFGAALWMMAAGSGVQSAPPRYRAEQLRCAAFTETIRTSVRGMSGGATVQAKAGRDGLIVISLRDSSDTRLVEAWYDSLVVWREAEGAREEPETDGFVGGRYRGTLAGDGRYRAVRDPFVPDGLGEVADLAGAMDDFLPRLPAAPIAPGGQWADSGYAVRRLPDRRDRSGPIERYQWKSTGRTGERYSTGDTTAVTLDQAIEEQGDLLWSATSGPLSWSRKIRITARIPATGGVRRSVRSLVEQEIAVVRRFDQNPSCR